MKIAIHNNSLGFTPRWIACCEHKGIDYKLVNCYDNDIVNQLDDCDALMWHHWHVNYKDIIKAKRLLFALEHAGKIVFPDFRTNWHFDDKIAQKYLLEALNLPIVPTYHFVDKEQALNWALKTNYPKVFKLTRGAGSANVRLVNSKGEAESIINKAFSSGFKVFDRFGSLKDRFRFFKEGKENLLGVLKSVYRVFIEPTYSKLTPKERYEVYFQEFIPKNEFDIRIIVLQNKAFAIKRLVRENDFRASGSGNILYEKEHFDLNLIKDSFAYAEKLKMQVVAFDFIFDQNSKPLIVEVSYGYAIDGYNSCVGYWDNELNFYEGKFDSCEWMVDLILKQKTNV